MKLAARGGKHVKRRAVVAVARQLAVLLHSLWVTGAGNEPLRPNGAANLPSEPPARNPHLQPSVGEDSGASGHAP
jgi:hypothetical protein